MKHLIAALALVLPGWALADTVDDLRNQATQIATDLSVPIAHCVQQRDTRHSAFAGCIDWHSSVHGTWALIATMNGLGNDRFDTLVKQRLTPARIAAERDLLWRHPTFEMPYGRAWFLRLSIDYEKRYDDGRLTDMAREVAESLLDALQRSSPRPWSGSYQSQSWAILNLMAYSDFVDDAGLKAQTRTLAQRLLAATRGPCPVDRERGNFMAICTNVAAIAVQVLPASEIPGWLGRTFDDVDLTPVLMPRNTHHYGLNFSRAWGLWEIYRATGSARWGAIYSAHVRASYDRPAHWNGDYGTVAHWVAQFGLYAIQPLFGGQNER